VRSKTTCPFGQGSVVYFGPGREQHGHKKETFVYKRLSYWTTDK
jgi:hypothetical protein